MAKMNLPGLALSATLLGFAPVPHAVAQAGWPTYGGDPGGQRFSTASQITPQNLPHLKPAWIYHTHALATGNPNTSRTDFEATPVLLGQTLFLSTPFDRVIALNAQSGAEQWTYDPHLPTKLDASNYTSRGVATWQASTPSPRPLPTPHLPRDPRRPPHRPRRHLRQALPRLRPQRPGQPQSRHPHPNRAPLPALRQHLPTHRCRRRCHRRLSRRR